MRQGVKEITTEQIFKKLACTLGHFALDAVKKKKNLSTF